MEVRFPSSADAHRPDDASAARSLAPPMPRTPVLLSAAAALLVAAAAVWFLLRPPPPPPAVDAAPALPSTPAEAPAMAAPAPHAAPAPAAISPADAGASAGQTLPTATPAAEATPPLPSDDAGLRRALIDLLGRDAVIELLQTDAFAERVVATVDALPSGHAAPRLWPVHPTEGRFTVDADNRITADNAARYDRFVDLVERIDPATAARLYRRLLPQLQSAYAGLGYPGRRFHDRLIEVIDHLLATPVAPPAPPVTLTDVKGPIASERPWVRYEFADPALESLSAGQRILLRVGDAHRQRLTAWLRAFRASIA